MAYVFYDRVRETCTTIGTGDLQFSGAVSGYQTFNSVLSNGDTTEVACVDSNGNWQTFFGTWNSATQRMVRTTAREGSAGAGVNVYFSGTDQVAWINFPAHKFENPHLASLSIGNTYSEPSGNRKYTFFQTQTISALGAVYRIGGSVSGTLGASLTGYYTTAMDSDTLKFTNTSQGMVLHYEGHSLNAGWSGGRATHQSYMSINGDGSAGDNSGGDYNAYHVSGSSFIIVQAKMGGTTGASKGNAFARNDGATLYAGAGYHINSIIGHEVDIGIRSGADALYKVGHKLGLWNDDEERGVIADYGYSQQTTPNLSVVTPGWRIGYALGGYEAWWPYTASTTLMKRVVTASSIASGAPAYNLGQGIDFNGITFTESQLKGVGYKIDPSGNLGALIASGVGLQTRSAVTAKTAVVNTITIVEGGLYAGTITLTCSAPTTSGTTATATVGTVSLPYPSSIEARGTDYEVGDTFTIDGGTFSTQAVGVVTVVSSGQVFGIKITTPGNYSVVPAGAMATTATSGSGSGLTIIPMRTILTVTVSGAGTNYSEFLPPTIASSGSITTFREAVFKVTMTATQAALDLNPGGGLVITASALGNYANDAAAAAGGVAVNGVYRNGSVLMVRVA